MRLIDSHCHLDDASFDNDLDAVLERMASNDVQGAMLAGVTLETARKSLSIAEKHDHLFAAVGIHPHDAQECSESVLQELIALAQNPKVKAWGETGLDFNRMFSPQRDQEKWLIRQMEIATDLNLPLIFHERDSNGRFIDILKDHFKPGSKGVVHCFSGNLEELHVYLSMGLYIGITGILTIKGRGKQLRRLVGDIPADRILVETDAPYLTPAPQKNQTRRNEPAFVRSTFMKLAEIKDVPPESLAEQLWQNTCTLFNLDIC